MTIKVKVIPSNRETPENLAEIIAEEAGEYGFDNATSVVGKEVHFEITGGDNPAGQASLLLFLIGHADFSPISVSADIPQINYEN